MILPCGMKLRKEGFTLQEAEGDWSQGFYSSRRPGLCRPLASGLTVWEQNLGAGASDPLGCGLGRCWFPPGPSRSEWLTPSRVGGGTTDGACCPREADSGKGATFQGGGSGCPVSEETKETTGVGAIRPGSCLWFSQ